MQNECIGSTKEDGVKDETEPKLKTGGGEKNRCV